MFDDIVPDATFEFVEVPAPKRTLLLTFSRDLTPTEAAAIAARLSSINDADMVDRVLLADLLEQVDTPAPAPAVVRDLLVALATRVLDA